MADLDMGKQIGPLPLGAWIAVVAGGLGIALYSRNSGTVEPYVVEDTGGTRLVDPVGDGSVGGWVSTSPSAPAAPDSGLVLDNDTWGRKAIDYLIAQGYNAADSYSAITTALSGEQVTVTGYSLWGAALRGIGAPPFPVLVLPPSAVPTVGYTDEVQSAPTSGATGAGTTGAATSPANTQHAWTPKSAINPKCKICGRWRNTWVHTNQNANNGGGGGGGTSGGGSGGSGGGVSAKDTPHRWERVSATNQHCRKCGRWRNTWVHTNRTN